MGSDVTLRRGQHPSRVRRCRRSGGVWSCRAEIQPAAWLSSTDEVRRLWALRLNGGAILRQRCVTVHRPDLMNRANQEKRCRHPDLSTSGGPGHRHRRRCSMG